MNPYRVCVADDCEEAAAVLSEGLRLHNYETFVARTGSEAVAICRSEQIDLLLLDVCMPEMDGYEACRQIKDHPETRDIAVIFVTVRGSVEDISLGYKVGAIDYITKPYNLPMVMVRVDAAIRGQKLQDPRGPGCGGMIDVIDEASTDPLTGLRNRPHFLQHLEEEVDKAHRYDYPVSCVVFDLDDIKGMDAELGPAPVDDLLIEVAMAMRTFTRNNDVLARYDGTVLAALLPHTPLSDAVNYTAKILHEIESMTFSLPACPTKARLSAGVAACQNGTALASEFVLGEAMRGLLQAKSLSGERLVVRQVAEA